MVLARDGHLLDVRAPVDDVDEHERHWRVAVVGDHPCVTAPHVAGDVLGGRELGCRDVVHPGVVEHRARRRLDAPDVVDVRDTGRPDVHGYAVAS